MLRKLALSQEHRPHLGYIGLCDRNFGISLNSRDVTCLFGDDKGLSHPTVLGKVDLTQAWSMWWM